jgi:hypothetical protein
MFIEKKETLSIRYQQNDYMKNKIYKFVNDIIKVRIDYYEDVLFDVLMQLLLPHRIHFLILPKKNKKSNWLI